MKLKQIRNATIIITYANKRFLIDPLLAAKGTYPPFPMTHNQHLNNPTVDLPVPIEEILDVDAVIVTHNHLDHLDPAAIEVLPKNIKVFTQNKDEAKQMKEAGFTNVEILLETGNMIDEIKLIKTPTQHYSDKSLIDLYQQLNFTHEACGVIFSHSSEKQLYIMGDTVLYDDIKSVLEKFIPDVIVINAGNAQLVDGRYLIMSKEEIKEVSKIASNAQLMATHMEGVNHAMLSRKELREYSEQKGFSDRLSIPADGEVCEY